MIVIDNEFALTADKYNFILLRKKENKKIYQKIGFFQNIEDAFKKYIELKIRTSVMNEEIKKCIEIPQKINLAMSKIEEAIKKNNEKLLDLEKKYKYNNIM